MKQTQTQSSSSRPMGPFTEAEVTRILVDYLGKQGYRIRANVPCPSGYIDLVAEKEGHSTFIEVKGEDEGGYTSAEMNFQIGLGQIISRMTNPAASYALAIPATDHYMRVLRKYKDSFGLKLLGLCFYLVSRNGGVDLYTTSEFTDFINNLK